MIETFDSLQDAAQASFSPLYCTIMAMREQGNAGYVLFDTAPSGSHYLYGVNYERIDGRWTEGSSSNGPSWSHVGSDPDRGTLSAWGFAPAGADRVRATVDGQVCESPIEHGVYLLVWWGVSADTDIGVESRQFRINGRWS